MFIFVQCRSREEEREAWIRPRERDGVRGGTGRQGPHRIQRQMLLEIAPRIRRWFFSAIGVDTADIDSLDRDTAGASVSSHSVSNGASPRHARHMVSRRNRTRSRSPVPLAARASRALSRTVLQAVARYQQHLDRYPVRPQGNVPLRDGVRQRFRPPASVPGEAALAVPVGPANASGRLMRERRPSAPKWEHRAATAAKRRRTCENNYTIRSQLGRERMCCAQPKIPRSRLCSCS